MQRERRFLWSFPDQHMQVAGTITVSGQPQAQLDDIETASGVRSSISSADLSNLPRIGEGLVIPRDSLFIDLEDREG